MPIPCIASRLSRVEFSHQPMNLSLGAVEVRHSGRRRFAQPADRRHRGHGLTDRSARLRRNRAQHGGAEQDRLLRFGDGNGQAGRIRHDLADQRTSSGAAADHHHVAFDAVRSKGFHDIGKAIGKPAEPGHEQPLHRADVDVEIHPCDDRARIGIGERRSVAEKLGQNVDVTRKQRRLAQACRARDDAPLEKFQNFHAGGMRRRDGLVIRRMGSDEMIDRRTGGGLTAFVEPEARNHSRIIGTPDAGNEARLRRRRHDAGRGPHDVSKATAHIDRLTRLPAPADRADAAGVSVDQRSADRRSLEQAEIVRGGFRSGRRPAACRARRSRLPILAYSSEARSPRPMRSK